MRLGAGDDRAHQGRRHPQRNDGWPQRVVVGRNAENPAPLRRYSARRCELFRTSRVIRPRAALFSGATSRVSTGAAYVIPLPPSLVTDGNRPDPTTARRGLSDFRRRRRGSDVIPAIQSCREIATPKGGLMAFELSAHMRVRPGQLEGFKKQAAECIRITMEKDRLTRFRQNRVPRHNLYSASVGWHRR